MYKETKINYDIVGEGDKPIVFLHGWGGNINSFLFITRYLNFNFKALFIDFPPFGKSETPKTTFTIFDYANIVEIIMEKNNLIKPTIVAHSFGGRVAILLASKNLAKNLILTASAGMKPKRTLKYYYRVIKHKICCFFGLKTNCGSKDYKQLSQNMKKTFSNIVSTFLEEYAIHISVPTLLFWGKRDKETPFYMAKRLKRLIKNCKIVSYKKSDHFCYLQNINAFVGVINVMSSSKNQI